MLELAGEPGCAPLIGRVLPLEGCDLPEGFGARTSMLFLVLSSDVDNASTVVQTAAAKASIEKCIFP